MNAVECIKTRRSVRRYKDVPVSGELIAEIVEIASFAPSWKNTQTSRYIAVLDQNLKNRVATECTAGFEKNIINFLKALKCFKAF